MDGFLLAISLIWTQLIQRIAHILSIFCDTLFGLTCHQIDDLKSVKQICPRAALFLLAVLVRLCSDPQFSQKRLLYGSDSINLHIINFQYWWSQGLIQWGCGNAGTRISKWVKSRHFEWKNNAESRIFLFGGVVRQCLEPQRSSQTSYSSQRKK